MTPVQTRLRDELLGRRQRLEAVAAAQGEERLVELLRRVDATLAQLETPDWGLCAQCHDAIEDDLLEADPSFSVCLECLSPEERRALEQDLAGAQRVQRALLPPSELSHDGWQVAWLWEPRGAVSGDYVDLLGHRGEPSTLDLLLGDVVGKGVSASLLQSHLHAMFRALAEPPRLLGEILSRANRLFCQATDTADYATLVAARLHGDGTVEMANAGHPRPLVADRRGVRPVEGAGLPLGLFGESDYDVRRLRLEPGETLLFYTDGWTEAATERGEYGVGRAAAALAAAERLPLAELLVACRDDMETFLADTDRPDDFTLLAVRRAETAPA
ncbi:MAG: SpoIIE family protein phosphatase [bacterium]|nr:SpoIIE family protein phosphatase [bacterium]